MIISFYTLAVALLGLVSARELSIVRKDSNQVLIKSKGSTDILWFSLSIKDGVPTFEVKGSKEDNEDDAKVNVQLAMENVHERDGGASYSLQGKQSHWEDLTVETQSGEKSPRQIALHGRMVRPEKDIAGNHFTVLLTAIIDEESSELSIRPMIQNFPYAYKQGKGLLAFKQVLISSSKVSKKEGANGAATFIGSAGDLLVLKESAFEDGNPGQLRDTKLIEAKDERGREQTDAVFKKIAEVQFATVRPKNVTFTEKLVLDPTFIKPAHPDRERKAEKDKIKGMSINAAVSHAQLDFAVGTVMAALVATLFQL